MNTKVILGSESNEPIHTFNEKLEKDISNIVGNFNVQEKYALINELLEYIENRDEEEFN